MDAAIEAILYTAGDSGVTLAELAHAIGVSESAARQQVQRLQTTLAVDTHRGVEIRIFADRFFLLTKPQFADHLKQYFAGPPAQGLSQAALEVLAIIAYQQPITRIEIDEIRGVQSSGALTTLAGRSLIKEAGRKEAPGRPILYATTPFFLDYFGLENIKQLPPLTDAQPQPSEVDLFNTYHESEPDTETARSTTETTEPMEDEHGSTN